MTPPSLTSPGWFGKLPGAGDFAHRRMPPALRRGWDNWLHDGLADLRTRHPGWIDAYLTSPVWGFLLGSGIGGESIWIGAMAPSVDRVGRYYPISLFAPLPPQDPAPSHWWQAAHGLLIQALESDADAHEFERLVSLAFTALESTSRGTPVTPALPGAGQSIWFHASSPQAAATVETSGLPRGPSFALLFDLQATAAHLENHP